MAIWIMKGDNNDKCYNCCGQCCFDCEVSGEAQEKDCKSSCVMDKARNKNFIDFQCSDCKHE